MPFEKVSASEWYFAGDRHDGTGLGYMWGVISQAIVGFDWIELAMRGAILGYILAADPSVVYKKSIGILGNIALCVPLSENVLHLQGYDIQHSSEFFLGGHPFLHHFKARRPIT